MKISKLALALAACGACAALPAAAQNPYYSNDSRSYSNDSRYYSNDSRSYGDTREAPAWRDRETQDRRDRGNYRDDRVARVVDVQPVAGSDQREECWNTHTNAYEEVRGADKARIASKDTAIGAVAGGVIGHQFGDHGAAATIGGALLGGLAGHAYEQHRNNEEAAQDDLDRSRCRVVADSGSAAYDVRYRYQGREYVARMDHQPGSTLVPGRDIDDDGHPYQSR